MPSALRSGGMICATAVPAAVLPTPNATPCRKRTRISVDTESLRKYRQVVSAKAAVPKMRVFFLPMTSMSWPMTSRPDRVPMTKMPATRPASLSEEPYASMAYAPTTTISM